MWHPELPEMKAEVVIVALLRFSSVLGPGQGSPFQFKTEGGGLGRGGGRGRKGCLRGRGGGQGLN